MHSGKMLKTFQELTVAGTAPEFSKNESPDSLLIKFNLKFMWKTYIKTIALQN
jgi:hypothetical protein